MTEYTDRDPMGMRAALESGTNATLALRVLNALQAKAEKAAGQTVYLNTWGFNQEDAVELQPLIAKVEANVELTAAEAREAGKHLAKYASQMVRLTVKALDADMPVLVRRAAAILMEAKGHNASELVETALRKGWSLEQTLEWAQSQGWTEAELESIRTNWRRETAFQSDDERAHQRSRMHNLSGPALTF